MYNGEFRLAQFAYLINYLPSSKSLFIIASIVINYKKIFGSSTSKLIELYLFFY